MPPAEPHCYFKIREVISPVKLTLAQVRSALVSFVLLTCGATLAAFALEEFLVPVTILDGGIVGISMILSQLTPFALGLLTFVLNIPFLIIGTRTMGLRFLVSTGYSMALFSILLTVFEHMTPATSDPLLAVVFGGVLLGSGVGLVLRGGGCLDGTETVALMVSRKTNLSVGQIVFGINVAIYAVAALLFGWDRAMYSLLTYFITFKVIDIVENGMEEAKSVMIITQDGAAMADTIYRQIGRTCTILEGAGLISGQKAVLYCVVTRLELPAIRRIIHQADQSAFVTVSDVGEIIGNHIKQVPVSSDATKS